MLFIIIKNLAIPRKTQKTTIIIFLLAYGLNLIANIIYGISTIFSDGMFIELLLADIALPTILPAVMFGLGYLVLVNKSKLSRAFSATLFALSCFLLSIISHFIYAMTFMDSSSINWVQNQIIALIVQVGSVVLVYGFFAGKNQSTIPRCFQLYFIILSLIVSAITLYTLSFGPGFMLMFWFTSTVIQSILSILFIGLGYLLLPNIKSNLQRLFLPCISTTLAIITYQSLFPVSGVFQARTIFNCQLQRLDTFWRLQFTQLV